ncbi:MAG: crossover junction endodeoxyribonuclease RuvC [Gammaproteobacteria bacterium]
MPIILGIDPGSRITGYGVIRADRQRHEYLASGCFRLQAKTLPERLCQIHEGIAEIIQTYCPETGAIEEVFFHENPNTALKLGHARGTAIAAMALHALPVAEYSARQVKKTIVGYGAAKKEQVQHMVKTLLNLSGVPQVDAADALAIALCHAFHGAKI